MLRHLLLMLFLIGLSLPAVAAPVQADTTTPAASCHDAMPMGTPHHQPDGDQGKASGHFCIGCVASPAVNLLTSPPPLAAVAPHIRPMTALAGADILPSIPPPRP